MTVRQINAARCRKGVFAAGNEAVGWYALSRDGIHMITFADDSDRFYTEKGFARRITKLINTGQ